MTWGLTPHRPKLSPNSTVTAPAIEIFSHQHRTNTCIFPGRWYVATERKNSDCLVFTKTIRNIAQVHEIGWHMFLNETVDFLNLYHQVIDTSKPLIIDRTVFDKSVVTFHSYWRHTPAQLSRTNADKFVSKNVHSSTWAIFSRAFHTTLLLQTSGSATLWYGSLVLWLVTVWFQNIKTSVSHQQ